MADFLGHAITALTVIYWIYRLLRFTALGG
jgi:hypothetical protein